MVRAPLPLPVQNGTLSPDLVEGLQAEPWRFGFLSLLRRIGANAAVDPIGTAKRPRAEPFRLGQQPSLTFASREIASARAIAGQLKIRLFGLGMLGPNGPLPLHITEIARHREESRRDPTTTDFFDVFHHRFFTLFYRAWASAQATAGLDRKDDEQFAFYVASLTGYDVDEIGQGPLPSHARLAASGHLVSEARNPDGLRAMLSHYFGVPVAIDENVFRWLEIDSDDRGQMGRPGSASTMGQGATLGRVVPDRQHGFRIVIGPVEFDAYQRFTPHGEYLPKLVEWVRAFVGHELDWELELRINPDSAQPAVMGGTQRIGQSGWLGSPRADRPLSGMRFEPERCVRYLKRCSTNRQEKQ
ncbi:type VI secretion system baseplate subunit TssG [Burkholderia ubonensis]|uniref:type VI secretion system baseplate subunit TssG n=1 Tax=Burkholderia ubonensis TaxID=101571 RepID=UPI0009B33F49|nr:type VI secretion system baseplate subunit TssG [Burkholderia ubonensis]